MFHLLLVIEQDPISPVVIINWQDGGHNSEDNQNMTIDMFYESDIAEYKVMFIQGEQYSQGNPIADINWAPGSSFTEFYSSILDNQTIEIQLSLKDAENNETMYTFSENIGDRTPPAIPVFNTNNILWLNESSRNTGNNQTIEVSFVRAPDVANFSVNATGNGTNNSGLIFNGNSYTDHSVYDNQSISYFLRLEDSEGNWVETSSAILQLGDRTAPNDPSMTIDMQWSAVNTMDNQAVQIIFNPSSDPDISRADVEGLSGIGVTALTTVYSNNYFVDSGLNDDQPVSYRVRVYDHNDNWFETNLNTTIEDRTAPAIPNSNLMSLQWVNNTDVNTSDNQDIQINFSLPIDPDVNNVRIQAASGDGASTSPTYTTSSSFLDENVHDNQTVQYKMIAYDAQGNYSESSVKGIVIGNRTPPIINYDANILSNNYIVNINNTSEVTSYDITLKENDISVIDQQSNISSGNQYIYYLPLNQHYNSIIKAYDAEGNHTTLTTALIKNNSFSTMDSLTYTYYPNSNRLRSVTDGIATGEFSQDYDTKNAVADQFTYDSNGNTTKDVNRDLDNIVYNRFNLPETITKSDGTVINYWYDGTGKRSRKQIKNSTATVTFDRRYIRNSKGVTLLEQDLLNSNRIVNKNIIVNGKIIGKEDYKYSGSSHIGTDTLYHLNDHLGNVRVTIKDKRSTGGTYEVVAEE